MTNSNYTNFNSSMPLEAKKYLDDIASGKNISISADGECGFDAQFIDEKGILKQYKSIMHSPLEKATELGLYVLACTSQDIEERDGANFLLDKLDLGETVYFSGLDITNHAIIPEYRPDKKPNSAGKKITSGVSFPLLS